jgi:hypothetical protein
LFFHFLSLSFLSIFLSFLPFFAFNFRHPSYFVTFYKKVKII